MESIYVAGGASAIVVTTVIEILKRSEHFSWITKDTSRVNATLSVLAALATGIGLSYTFEFNPDSGHFSAAFSGNVWDIVTMLGHSAWQWCQQHFVYQISAKPTSLMIEILKELQKANAGKPNA